MKKTIAILLVAILAVSSVFAAFSGEAKLGFGGNLDNGNFGFIDKSADVKFDLELATADAESVGEGDVYASIKATFALKLSTGEKKYGEGDPYGGIYNGGEAIRTVESTMAAQTLELLLILLKVSCMEHSRTTSSRTSQRPRSVAKTGM